MKGAELMITSWDNRYTEAVIRLWNEAAVKDGYKEMTEQSFKDIFLNSRYFDPACTFVWLESDTVCGFACGCTGDDLPLGERSGYITCVIVAEPYQTDECFGGLLKALEERFRMLGKQQAEVLFFNPMHLPWYIPDTPGHEHNNAPGVPIGSRLHTYLSGHGYIERAVQCAMYLDLEFFTCPADVYAKELKAAEKGYETVLFDPDQHTGVDEMLKGFDNPLWQEEINRSLEKGIPVVIAAHRGTAVGFAGPVIRQSNGRGYFAGIGVHPEHEGRGLGSLLFFKLCEAFKSIGTEYMSLYTGQNNPAIRIYEKAGFKTVKTFSVMRRELT